MLFNSFHFLLFFTVVVIGYFLLPHKFRWILLLIASYYFYMCWRPALILLIVFSTLSNYVLARRIAVEKNKRLKKNLLLLSLMINFGLLFVFKYSVFFNHSAMALFETGARFIYGFNASPAQAAQKAAELLSRYPAREFDIVLPMGISFYTFQAASYTIDVYKGEIKPVRHYGIFSLFITFFPQLVAGPIERSKNLLPQFFKKHTFDKERLLQGCKLMLLGYFKKIVIADRVAVAVNTIYNSPGNYTGLYLVTATLLFTLQIYCDFSGYSDIAVGSARVLGFDLMKNFDKPYLSRSIREFWRRWHISLSTWFADYVYIPLGGNRCSKLIQCRNVMITFLVSGLWHGANWTFVLWGGLHGLYQSAGIVTEKLRKRIKGRIPIHHVIKNGISVVFTFCLVAFAWIFFRANTIHDAFYIISHLLDDITYWFVPQYLYEVATGIGVNLYELKIILISIAFLMLSEIISGKQSVYGFIEKRTIVVRMLFYVFIATWILTTGVFYDAGAFIYFQF